MGKEQKGKLSKKGNRPEDSIFEMMKDWSDWGTRKEAKGVKLES